ncbi:TRAP transporter small permease [Desulfovibrio psychrotolerans]|uniref:C4-dicarboxylate ABC transporter permease n=1 Tax=Desulfovibrio psychrotolerans TaxID=415242 RepID=A0A7J0BS10_9BACT|nr:TRAP transporter small permease [Desulfovibrio psychrotolerans]GFM36503.1 C4-dicarboxylate ABC transporter permease [Desulfovibrio psychrotolerans]
MNTFITKLEEGIISLLLAAMTLLVFVEVVMRFAFGIGIHWAQELTLLLSGWMVLFGVSYGIKVGSHIGVDALVKLFPEHVQRAVSIFAITLCLIYSGLFLVGSWLYLEKLMLVGIELEDIPVPKWAANSIIFIGMLLLAVRLMEQLLAVVRGEAVGFKLKDEAKESLVLAQGDEDRAKPDAGTKTEKDGEAL